MDAKIRESAWAEYRKYFRAVSEWDNRSGFARVYDYCRGAKEPTYPVMIRLNAEKVVDTNWCQDHEAELRAEEQRGQGQ